MISKFNIDILSCPSDECLFLALKILCISTRTLARSACSRGFSTKSFSVPSFQHNVTLFFQNLGTFWTSFVQQSNKTVPKCSWLVQFHHTQALWKVNFCSLFLSDIWIQAQTFYLAAQYTSSEGTARGSMFLHTSMTSLKRTGLFCPSYFTSHKPNMKRAQAIIPYEQVIWRGKKPLKETKPTATKLLKAPNFNLLNLTELLVCF